MGDRGGADRRDQQAVGFQTLRQADGGLGFADDQRDDRRAGVAQVDVADAVEFTPQTVSECDQLLTAMGLLLDDIQSSGGRRLARSGRPSPGPLRPSVLLPPRRR